MTAITFDTLEYSATLQESGIPREQADAMAKANAKALKDMVKSYELATKQDLLAVKHDLENSIHGVENTIANTKHDILKWIMAMIIAESTLTLGAIGICISLLLGNS